MKHNRDKLLLQDPEIKSFIQTSISEKSKRLEILKPLVLKEATIDKILTKELTVNSFKALIDNFRYKDRLKRLKKDLRRTNFHLKCSEGKISRNSEWEKAYEFATQQVQIADVVSNLTGISNLKRNIKCPFHEDKSPSFKVYEKDNRFVCFGCGARGSPIDFYTRYQSCSFKEAVLSIYHYFN